MAVISDCRFSNQSPPATLSLISGRGEWSFSATLSKLQPLGELELRGYSRRMQVRTKGHVVDQALDEQFATGRLYACVASRPGQCGRCDGYILEGKELEFYVSCRHIVIVFIFSVPMQMLSTVGAVLPLWKQPVAGLRGALHGSCILPTPAALHVLVVSCVYLPCTGQEVAAQEEQAVRGGDCDLSSVIASMCHLLRH